MLRAIDNGFEFIPEASGVGRIATWDHISKVLERFNSTASLRPVDYRDVTRNSSYILATILCLYPSATSDAASSAVELLDSVALKPEPPSMGKDKPHQRVGAVSNAHVGADFERVALEYFAQQGISLSRNFPVEVGLSVKKLRHFDLGSADERVLVECKSHRWTAGGRVPSAKMTVWNEAMYYFLLAPNDYRKILFVLHDKKDTAGESLLAYYSRTYTHLIPDGVEILEWNEETGSINRL